MAWSRNGDQYPRFQLWRPDGTDRYQRVYESNTDSCRFMTLDNSGLTIAEYVPPDPVPFQVGDVLGLYQPDSDSRRLSVTHVSVPGNFGHVNFVGQTDEADIDTEELSALNDFPVVTVNTSKNHFWWATLTLAISACTSVLLGNLLVFGFYIAGFTSSSATLGLGTSQDIPSGPPIILCAYILIF